MNPPKSEVIMIEGRRMNEKGSPSMERFLGELQGQMSGVREALIRIESAQVEANRRMETIALDHSRLKTEAKIGWKLLTGIAAATSVGGASVKHFLEKIL
jgi:hypothetical protein